MIIVKNVTLLTLDVSNSIGGYYGDHFMDRQYYSVIHTVL